MRSRTDSTRSLLTVSANGGTLAGGSGGGAPSSTSSTYLPRATGEVRLASDVMRQDRAAAEQAEAIRIGQRDAAEAAARRRSGCRSAGPAPRPRRCSRRSAGRAMLRSSRTMLSNSSSTSRRIDCGEVAGEVGEDRRLGMDLGQAGEPQPLRRRSGRQALGAPVGEHALDLSLRVRPASSARPWRRRRAGRRPGRLPHRKNDRREASSRSRTR